MSAVAVTLFLAALLLLLLRTNQLGMGSALVAIVFGLVLGSTPAGSVVNGALTQAGSWAWAQVRTL